MYVPSEMKSRVKYLPVTVPVANVPVDLNPVPNVIVYEVVPLVRIIKLTWTPAGATVVVNVPVAVGVTLTHEFVPKAIARVPFARAA
jgi:hypothetical protein